ncbi:unnamed protein product [Lactuca saligna]|uniref:Uncharacterized protein n=1 Tax=Lactuca saligna TaxID=75948 RepID=A0AA35YV46_LACSI|nr:unnamed protein product [Lactuca saligna]
MSLIPKIDKKAKLDDQNFGKLEDLVNNIKKLVSKTGSSFTSLLTQELLTKKLRLLESPIHNELAPVAKLVNLMPTDATSVHTGVQGGEGIGVGMDMGSKISMGGSGSSKGNDDAKVVGNVIST